MNDEKTRTLFPEENAQINSQNSNKSETVISAKTSNPAPDTKSAVEKKKTNGKGKGVAVAGAAFAGTLAGAAGVVGAAVAADEYLADDDDSDASGDYVNDANLSEDNSPEPQVTANDEVDYTENQGADPVIAPEEVPVSENEVEVLGVEDDGPMQEMVYIDGEEVANVVEVDLDGDGIADGYSTTDGEMVETVYDLNHDGQVDAVEVNDGQESYIEADMDGDGIVDTVVQEDESGYIAYHDSDGDGVVDTVQASDGVVTTVTVDVDGDGDPDLYGLDENMDGIIDENEVFPDENDDLYAEHHDTFTDEDMVDDYEGEGDDIDYDDDYDDI